MSIHEAVTQLLTFLEHARRRPYVYADGVEATDQFLRGIRAGLAIIYGDVGEYPIRRELMLDCGWHPPGLWPWDDMRSAGMSDEMVVDEIYGIEIAVWQRVLQRLESGVMR